MTSGEAPAFELTSLTGESTTLDGLLAGGPVLLVFYKAACPTCQLTFPFLERLHRGRSADAPRIVAISQDDAATTEEFNRRFGITFLTLCDPAGQRFPVSAAYLLDEVPSLFLVRPGRRIALSVSGFDKATLEGLGTTFGVATFTAEDRVPVFRPG